MFYKLFILNTPLYIKRLKMEYLDNVPTFVSYGIYTDTSLHYLRIEYCTVWLIHPPVSFVHIHVLKRKLLTLHIYIFTESSITVIFPIILKTFDYDKTKSFTVFTNDCNSVSSILSIRQYILCLWILLCNERKNEYMYVQVMICFHWSYITC